jgi:hypothetical protein
MEEAITGRVCPGMENKREVNIILAVTALGKQPIKDRMRLEENVIIANRKMG